MAGRRTSANEEIFTVVIDTREQKPYRFPRFVVRTLPTGDYSIDGLEDRITVERKSKADAYSSIGQQRARLKRELERMAEFDYAAIVVESSLRDFLSPPPFSQLHPRAAIQSLISWSVKFNVHVFFADDRAHGNALVAGILTKYAKNNDTKEA